MSKGLIFFCCSCAILLFTTINLSVGPIVSKRVGSNWGVLNCQKAKDDYDKEKGRGTTGNALKYGEEWKLYACQRRKAMHDLEYTSFIFDIVIGFVCGLLGLLHLFELKKEFVSKTGLIGLGCGVVGFVLTFIYVVYNGLVYTNYYDNSVLYKRNSDGAFAEWKGNHYECLYYGDGNPHAIIAKYSDLINKQYNYDKDLLNEFSSGEASECHGTATDCINNENLPGPQQTYQSDSNKNCKYLYVSYSITGVENKDKSDRFLTTLILSLFVCLANIGLALFGFLLFRTPGEF